MNKIIIIGLCVLIQYIGEANALQSMQIPVSPMQAQKIYREGILPSGEILIASTQKDVQLEGEYAACASCHRRSGMGTSEGQLIIPPITRDRLFEAKVLGRKDRFMFVSKGAQTRPAYNEVRLERAIRQGVDPAGREFSQLMPRYDLSTENMQALIAYVKTLNSDQGIGLTDKEIHFSTIITPNTTTAQEKALLDVLELGIKEKNAGTRHETRRATGAPWVRDWKYEAYRKWVLHVWKLTGPEETWSKQLEQFYTQQPVFAMLSGLIENGSDIIQHFCEQHEMPCLFPNVKMPQIIDTNYYTFYFSNGILLDAKVLAKYLDEKQKKNKNSLQQIVQIYRSSSTGAILAEEFSEQLKAKSAQKYKLMNRIVVEQEKIDAIFWQQIQKKYPDALLAIWLSKKDLNKLDALAETWTSSTAQIIFSSVITPGWAEIIPSSLKANVLAVHQFVPPSIMQRHIINSNDWLEMRRIVSSEQLIQTNAYFTLRLLGKVMMHIRDNFSREYFIELLEHMTEKMLVSSVFPRLTLGPGQRFASKGAYILGFLQPTSPLPEPVSQWIIP
ncbi:MAG: c-type cytochrome [Methylococcaceae bacterium]|nr:c-type cytochrome [Methylococcaceae bacterium]